MKWLSLRLVLAMPVLLVALWSPAPALAYSNTRLMDDAVFDNVGSMNLGQIRAFLSGQDGRVAGGSTCLSSYQATNFKFDGTYWHYGDITATGPSDPNYNYRWDSSYGPASIPAAQVVYQAAQQWGLNPQVILSTLEKEESLVSGTSCDSWRYNSAMGYGCPDSGGCNPKYAGLSRQVLWGSWQLKFNKERSYGNTAWDDDGDLTYVGYMTQGIRKRCTACANNYYSGTITIDGQQVQLENGTTASLYTYTPHLGQSFPGIFQRWFGSVLAPQFPSSAGSLYARSSTCPVPSFGSGVVGRLEQPNSTDYLLTTSWSEACAAVKLGYIWDGPMFQDYAGAGAAAVYRLSNGSRHFYTANTATRDAYINSYSFHSEGVAFHASLTAQTGLLPVYTLTSYFGSTLTSSTAEMRLWQQSYGYTNQGIDCYAQPVGAVTQSPVHRLARMGSYLYTVDMGERDAAVSRYGFADEGAAFTAVTATTQDVMPVYRLRGWGNYFYTTERWERDYAVIGLGLQSEGVAFYVPDSSTPGSKPVMRLGNNNGNHLYTVYSNEAAAAGSYGYAAEGTKFYAY